MTLTFFGWLSHTIRLQLCVRYTVLTPSLFLKKVWPPPISLATTLGISFDFFSSPYLDVSVREVPLVRLCIHRTIHGSSPWGFPHSEICGSGLICSSPQLIAACRVLLRLLMPRHSPYALLSLNSCRISLPIFFAVLFRIAVFITLYSYLVFFALAKLFSLPYFLRKDLILHHFFFPN